MTQPITIGTPTGQRQDYLNRQASAVIKADGTATCVLTPGVGEYWAPKFVRVSIVQNSTAINSAALSPYAAVYQGANTITDKSTFIDDTFSATGDTSSIISGTVIQYGESITAEFASAQPGDVALFTVFGTASNTPPSISELPSVPGTHFSGKPSTEFIETVMDTGPFVQGPQSGTNFGIFLDMRQFQSYYLDMSAVVVGSPTEHVPILLVLRWFFNTATSQVSYQDTLQIWADNLNPTVYFFAGGVMSLQDTVHGPFLQITVSNGAVSTSATLSVTVAGTSRTVPAQYVRQQASSDGVVGNSSATITGGQAFIPCCLGYGQAQFILQNGATAGTNFFVKYGSGVANYVLVSAVAANVQTIKDVTLPKRAALVTATGTNGSAVGLVAVVGYQAN